MNGDVVVQLLQLLDFLNPFLTSFVSFLSAIIVALIGRMLYDKWRSPKLSAYPSKNDPAVAKHVTPNCGLYHIVTKNQKTRLGLMVKPIQNARVRMIFRDKNGKELFAIPAKWDFRPEPLSYTQKGISANPSLIPQGELLDINPGSGESFCVVIKYMGEDEIYGFNAYSYLHNKWKNDAWKLGKGEYHVQIVLNVANAYKEFHFLLRNNGSDLKDVKLEKLHS